MDEYEVLLTRCMHGETTKEEARALQYTQNVVEKFQKQVRDEEGMMSTYVTYHPPVSVM